jgi:hypothetical protein
MAMKDTARQSQRDRGVAQAMLMRLESHRLPHVLILKKKVDSGELLSEYDTRFLKDVLKESREAQRLAERLPQYKELVTRMSSLYDEVVKKGLENQKNPPKIVPPEPDDFH